MREVAIGMGIAIASLVMSIFAYRLCTTVARIDDVLPRWASERGLHIIHKESRIFFRGPFLVRDLLWSSCRPVYYVTLQDPQSRQRKAWICLGRWYFVGFKEHVEVVWEE